MSQLSREKREGLAAFLRRNHLNPSPCVSTAPPRGCRVGFFLPVRTRVRPVLPKGDPQPLTGRRRVGECVRCFCYVHTHAHTRAAESNSKRAGQQQAGSWQRHAGSSMRSVSVTVFHIMATKVCCSTSVIVDTRQRRISRDVCTRRRPARMTGTVGVVPMQHHVVAHSRVGCL